MHTSVFETRERSQKSKIREYLVVHLQSENKSENIDCAFRKWIVAEDERERLSMTEKAVTNRNNHYQYCHCFFPYHIVLKLFYIAGVLYQLLCEVCSTSLWIFNLFPQ